MRKYRYLLIFIILYTLTIPLSAQDGIERHVNYGQTVSGIFASESDSAHEWRLDVQENDVLEINVRRIGGIFTPDMRLLDPSGNEVIATHFDADEYGLSATFRGNILSTGVFRIVIEQENDQSENILTQNEYSLTVQQRGQFPLDFTGQLNPIIPDILNTGIPDYFVGESNLNQETGIQIFGEAIVTQLDIENQISRFAITGTSSIEVANTEVVAPLIPSIAILPDGIALQTNSGAVVFTDRNIGNLSLDSSVLSITLDNGTNISTDFFAIDALLLIDNIIQVHLSNGRKMVFEGTQLSLTRRGGIAGEGPNAEAILIVQVDDSRIETDMNGWDIFSILNESQNNPITQVIYGDDLLFRSNELIGSYLLAGNQALDDADSNRVEIRIDYAEEASVNFDFELNAAGTITINNQVARMTLSGGADIPIELPDLDTAIFDNQVLRLEKSDNTVTQILPDGTRISSPPAPPVDSVALPFEAGFRPQNFNNAGLTVTDYHPRVDMSMALEPVNRVIGNFIYSVDDMTVPGHALTLDWTRTYNSILPENQDDSPQSPINAHFGNGWRHSYHYQLDTSLASVGEVQLTLADGSIHIFEAETGTLYRSDSLLSWTIERQGNFSANWIAYDADGIQYHFDTAGRLERITHSHGYTLLFSPVPQRYLDLFDASGGFFVTEHYGRRLEIYTDAENRIIAVRGVQGRVIQYNYEGDLLVEVDYPGEEYSATYAYDTNGFLNAIDDTNSPYSQVMTLAYNENGQVINYDLNLDAPLNYSLSYRDNRTVETARIGNTETERVTIWEYDNDYRLTRLTPPDSNLVYEWLYVPDTGLLSEIIQPTRTRLRFRYDEMGYLIRFTDPLFATSGTGFYALSYRDGDNHTRLLSQIDTPGISNWKSYSYDDSNLLTSIEEAFTNEAGTRQSIVTGYTYDSNNRLETISEVNPDLSENALITHYTYDAFGYPSEIRLESSELIQNWQLLYDGVGRLLASRDIDGRLATLQWHPDRPLIEQIAVAGEVYQYGYDDRDNLIHYVSPDENLSYTYDSANRVISMRDIIERETTYAYDDYGNLARLTLPDGSFYQYSYDNMNRLAEQIAPDGFITSYSTELNLYSITDALNETILYEFDPLGRLRQVKYDYQDGLSYDINLNYDARGNAIRLIDNAGRSVTVDYNFIGYPLATTFNDSLETRYAYDASGLLSSVSNPAGQRIAYHYDVAGNPVQVMLPGDATLNYDYDNRGNILSYSDAENNILDYRYDAPGRLIEAGHTEYIYDTAGNLISVIDALDNETIYLYDEVNRLLRRTTAGNAITRYEYDLLDNPTQIIEANFLQTDYTYDAANHVVAVTQPQDREYLYSRDAGGRITAVTNPAGQTTTYAYNLIGEIGRITNPSGHSETFAWYGNGQIVTYELLDGTEYQYNSDDFGRLIQIVNSRSGESSFIRYDDAGNILEIQTRGGRYQYSYDERGNIISYLPPGVSNPYTYDYDSNNRPIRITNPENITTGYVYDASGNITEISYANNTDRETFQYDATGNLVESNTRDGITRVYDYDPDNRLIAITENGLTTAFEYDGAGNVTRIIEPGERETRYLYDLFGNLLAIEQIESADTGNITLETTYSYDSADNLLSVTSPGSETVNMTYNSTGQRVRYIDAADNSWSYSYDDAGNLEQVNNPPGNNQIFAYDNANRIESIIFEQDARIEFSYDSSGYLSRVTLPENASNRTEILQYTVAPGFNLLGIGHVSGTGVSEDFVFTHTASGLIETIRSTDAEISITYDAYGNIAAITAENSDIARIYDAAGRLISLEENNIEHVFDYDAGQITSMRLNENLVSEDGTINPVSLLNTTYRYDDYGRLQIRHAENIGQIEYAYDTFNRPVTITFGNNEYQLEIDYNLNGWRTAVRRSNDVNTSYDYDENGRVESIAHTLPGEERAYSFAYEYDTIGNLIRLTRSDNSSILYSYDEARQLIGERWLDESNQIIYAVTYSYDAVGNRIEQTERFERSEPSRTAFIYNSLNQLDYETRGIDFEVEDRANLPFVLASILVLPLFLIVHRKPRWMPVLLILVLFFAFPVWQMAQSPRDVEYAYDTDGNLMLETFIDGRQIAYDYDAFNRLVAITETQPDGETSLVSTIHYDSTGRVVSITENDASYDLIYDAFGLIAIQSAEGLQIHYSPAESDTTLIQTEDAIFWTIDDGAGQLSRFADESGAFVTDTTGFTHNAFGEMIFPQDADTPVSTDFLEQIHLSQSDIVLMGVRAYHPRTGRFLQRDPVRHDPRGNLYTYAYNNPLNFSDPTGMITESAADGIMPDIPDVNPANFIHKPGTPAIPAIPDIATLQEQEHYRLLDAAYTLQFEVNDVVFALADSACDLFIHTVNPINELQQSQLAENRQQMLAMYSTRNAWLPDLPQPGQLQSPLTQLEELLPLLARSLQSGEAFQSCSQALALPDVPMPVADEFFARLGELPSLLEQTDLYPVTIAQVPQLLDFSAPIAQAADINPIALEPMILPEITGQVGQLQDETARFYMDLLLPLTDENLFRWQTGYQAENVAPVATFAIEN